MNIYKMMFYPLIKSVETVVSSVEDMNFELLSVEVLCNLCSVERVTCLFIVFHFHCGFSCF